MHACTPMNLHADVHAPQNLQIRLRHSDTPMNLYLIVPCDLFLVHARSVRACVPVYTHRSTFRSHVYRLCNRRLGVVTPRSPLIRAQDSAYPGLSQSPSIRVGVYHKASKSSTRGQNGIVGLRQRCDPQMCFLARSSVTE